MSRLPFIAWWLVAVLAAAGPLSAANPPAIARTADGREAVVLGFDVLASFPYEVSDPATPASPPPVANQIPAQVREFNGRRAVVAGFMVPLQLEDGRARRFVLVRNQASCCYGVAPAMNEYVLVTMSGPGVRPILDTPISVVGTLKVGETYEDGFLVGIYQFDGEVLEDVKS